MRNPDEPRYPRIQVPKFFGWRRTMEIDDSSGEYLKRYCYRKTGELN